MNKHIDLIFRPNLGDTFYDLVHYVGLVVEF